MYDLVRLYAHQAEQTPRVAQCTNFRCLTATARVGMAVEAGKEWEGGKKPRVVS